ncbi:MAG TPA: TIM-barrel domain-containing protein [Ignavibacteriales bacterium]|nr:TIM-barrel domain-containing protein [Ignavibacteriales bacterium]
MNLLRRFSLIIILFPAFLSAQTYPGNFTSYSAAGRVTLVNAGSTALRFTFYKPEIVKVDFIPSPGTKFDSSLVVIQDTSEAVPIMRSETDSTLEIASAGLRVRVSKYPLRITYYDLQGNLLLKDKGGFSFSGSTRSVEFRIQQNEHFYGTGERGTDLDKRGQAFSSYNTQMGGYTSPLEVMMINIPFAASTNGYAIYFENTYPGYWNFGQNGTQAFSYSASGGELSYYLIAARGIPEQLSKYTWLTGRQPLPPRWALGYIQSKYGYHDESEARTMVQTMQEKNIPLDAIVLDLYWFKAMGDISWDLSKWPNPFKMMNDFLALGVKTVAITEPYITESSPNFSEAASKGYFAKNSQGSPFVFSGWWSCGCNAALLDITNPLAQQWWWNMHPSFFGSQMAGIWTDLGEPERDNAQMQYYMGPSAKVHNVYNLLWARTIFNGFKSFRPNERLFNLTRSGYAGIQRYSAITWSGDVGRSFGGLAVQLPIMLNMGLSGLGYHNSDIGGFTGGYTTAELYARWMEFGSFCPITRAHGTGQDTEPWVFGTGTEVISRKFIQLRYQLIPYIYTMAYENYATGMPLARPLFFDYPTDEKLYNLSTSYMWGSSMLVSPVTAEGQASKSIYLPEGLWVDFFDDHIYNGGQTVTVLAPVEKLPVFIKMGSIIPMQPVIKNTEEIPSDTLVLRVYPSLGTPGSFTLYEDDGKTLSYQNGQFSKTLFTQRTTALEKGNSLELTIGESQGIYTGKPPFRTYMAEVHLISGKPEDVIINGRKTAYLPTLSELKKSTEGFFYDNLSGTLFIQLKANADSAYHITASNISLITDVQGNNREMKFSLLQNYPNPFNPATKIKFSIAEKSFVKLTVYDILGRKAARLIDKEMPRGDFEINFDAGSLPSGVYIYELNCGSYREVKKMNLVK